MVFEVYQGRRGLLLRRQWRWRLRARNGRIVATGGGDGYNNRADCLGALQQLRDSAAAAPIKVLD